MKKIMDDYKYVIIYVGIGRFKVSKECVFLLKELKCF